MSNGNHLLIRSTSTITTTTIIRRGKKNALSEAEKTENSEPTKKQKTTLSSSSIPSILAALPKRKPISDYAFINSNAVVGWLKIPFEVSQFEGDEIRIIMTNTFFEFFATYCGIPMRDIASEIVSWIPVEDFFLASMQNTTRCGSYHDVYNDGAVPYFVAAILQQLHRGEWTDILPTIRRIVRNFDMKDSLNVEKCPQYCYDHDAALSQDTLHFIIPEWRHFCVTWFALPWENVSATPSYVLSRFVEHWISDAARSISVESTFPFVNDVFEFLQVTGLAMSVIPPLINSRIGFPLDIARTFVSRLIEFNRYEELAAFSTANLRGVAQWVERFHFDRETPVAVTPYYFTTEWHHLHGLTLNRDVINNRMSYDFMKTWLLLEKHGAINMGAKMLGPPRRFLESFVLDGRDYKSLSTFDEDVPLDDENPDDFLSVGGVVRLEWQVPPEVSLEAFVKELLPGGGSPSPLRLRPS